MTATTVTTMSNSQNAPSNWYSLQQVDVDEVDRSNLQRNLEHTSNNINIHSSHPSRYPHIPYKSSVINNNYETTTMHSQPPPTPPVHGHFHTHSMHHAHPSPLFRSSTDENQSASTPNNYSPILESTFSNSKYITPNMPHRPEFLEPLPPTMCALISQNLSRHHQDKVHTLIQQDTPRSSQERPISSNINDELVNRCHSPSTISSSGMTNVRRPLISSTNPRLPSPSKDYCQVQGIDHSTDHNPSPSASPVFLSRHGLSPLPNPCASNQQTPLTDRSIRTLPIINYLKRGHAESFNVNNEPEIDSCNNDKSGHFSDSELPSIKKMALSSLCESSESAALHQGKTVSSRLNFSSIQCALKDGSMMISRGDVEPNCHSSSRDNSNYRPQQRDNSGITERAATFNIDTRDHHSLLKKNEKHFPCSVCKSRFSRRHDLLKHFNIVHKKIRPFGCDTCGSCFGQKHHLVRHKRAVHIHAKDFACPFCPARFTREEHLNNHGRSVHGLTPQHSCSMCGVQVADKRSLKSHYKTVHQVTGTRVDLITKMLSTGWQPHQSSQTYDNLQHVDVWATRHCFISFCFVVVFVLLHG